MTIKEEDVIKIDSNFHHTTEAVRKMMMMMTRLVSCLWLVPDNFKIH